MNDLSHLLMSLSYTPTDKRAPEAMRKAADEVDRLTAENERLTKKAEHLQNRVTNLWLEGYAMIGRMEQVREVLAGTDANSLPRDYSLVQVAKDRMNDLKEARAEVDRLAARVWKFGSALRPFAEALKGNWSQQPDDMPIEAGPSEHDLRLELRLGDFRKAKAALGTKE